MSLPSFNFIFNLLGSLFSSTDGIEIGQGAAIFELKNPSKRLQPSYRNKRKQCEIKVKVPQNYGITAYIEEMHMRKSRSDGDCYDFIQFGQDDKIPFMTLTKSERICGHINGKVDAAKGRFYDDPKGDLLIWINLGGRRKMTYWDEISTVNLTLVVTAYKVRKSGWFFVQLMANSCFQLFC